MDKQRKKRETGEDTYVEDRDDAKGEMKKNK